jgi:HEAT repeat protein
VRGRVVGALTELRDPKSVDALITTLKDSDASVRRRAIGALAEVRDVRATPAVVALLKDAERTPPCGVGARRLRDRRSTDGLVAALVIPSRRCARTAGACRAARSEIGGWRLIAATRDDEADVRSRATALTEIRDVRAVDALVAVPRSERRRARAA